MASRNITIDDLNDAIKNGTAYTGAGQFDGEHRTFLVQPQGQLSKAEDYENLIVSQNKGAPVYLKDIAKATDSVQDERINMRFWVRGQQVPSATVVVAVFRRAGSNAVEVAKEVRDAAPSIRATLPSSVDVDTDLRPLANDREQRERRKGDAGDRVCAGGAGYFPVSGARHGHADSRR